MPDAKNAKTSEPAGTATSSQRGCRRRRSIRTWVLSTCHQQADLLDVGHLGGELAEDRALVHDGDAVREREDLVEVLAQQQHRDAPGRRLAQVAVDRLDR